ncbi:DNA/RNA non-specific endonuclease [Denitrobacterium detoxificans]|uniref:DNA/RNA non-specific endonuclease n=1 Tax=Denitrobacterium detoxificans TaxID=79604 RepID=A0A1H8TWT9_9ACTN|nr:DNA/RNA non-specific endonuclease [Denitrobacterium detoxificans]SEO95500.1 DNA/RNA non-specific endonuclease [Denitrobacterium detoxificans]
MHRIHDAAVARALYARVLAAVLALCLSFGGVALAGCSSADSSSGSSEAQQTVATQSSGSSYSAEQADPSAQAGERLAAPTEWDEAASPDYYRVVGPAVCDYAAEEGVATYQGLDSHSRAGAVYTVVTYSMMEAGLARERQDMSDLHPSGWQQNQQVSIQMPDGTTYNGYFYNRSHLLAKSLGGKEALENLITGTRTQNVGANDQTSTPGGMAYAETKARDWLEAHPEGTVYYAATPLYVGDELVARSVVVDIRSSDGSIDEEVEVYNCAKGYVIDYATGAYASDGSAPEPAASEGQGSSSGSSESAQQEQSAPAESSAQPEQSATSEAHDYVMNTNTHKFHYPDCSSVKKMSPKNKQEVHCTRDELIAQGYEPCKNCRP